jgi:hypothetical protein
VTDPATQVIEELAVALRRGWLTDHDLAVARDRLGHWPASRIVEELRGRADAFRELYPNGVPGSHTTDQTAETQR